MISLKTVLSLVVLTFVVPATVALAQQDGADSQFKQRVAAAQEAMGAGKYPQAIDVFKKILKERKNCADCWLGMAYAYLRIGDAHEAGKSVDQALSFASDDHARAAAHNLKGQLFFALSKEDPKSLGKSEGEFREAIRLAPEMPDYYLNDAQALLKQTKDEDATRELTQCLALHPSPATAELAKKFLADPRRGREDFAPDFAITTLQGDHVSSQQLAGKLVVIDFWATWCPPCRASVPELKELTRKYPNRLVLISVSADSDDARWREFVSKHEMTWHQYRDSNHQVLDTFGIHAFPTYFVIDGDGVIKQRIVGMNPQETIVHRLKEYLAGVPELAAK